MAKAKTKTEKKKAVETFVHDEERRVNIPTAELESIVPDDEGRPIPVEYPRSTDGLDEEKDSRIADLDPQLVWKGKSDEPLRTVAPTLYIQEKVHPKVLIDDLRRETERSEHHTPVGGQRDLFSDFNGIPEGADKYEFYMHDQNWSNRMIAGDSLNVMASLAEKEGLRGKVQCIYFDPPYGIKFNKNFQWSTTDKDGDENDIAKITREPEQVKAFRDTWRNGIHSYLSYIRDRLTIARELLTDSGSIFVQIGDDNVHLVRSVLDEVFGSNNFYAQITYASTSGLGGEGLSKATNYILWSAKNINKMKFRPLLKSKVLGGEGTSAYRKIEFPDGRRMSISDYNKVSSRPFDFDNRTPDNKDCKVYTLDNIRSSRPAKGADVTEFEFQGKTYTPRGGTFKTNAIGLERLMKSSRLDVSDKNNLGYIRYYDDFLAFELNNIWNDTLGQNQLGGKKIYVVQTALTVIRRCMLMSTDPGDLVLDPTCGSGSTAYVAEQWGRRWITIDTSRVALALARARLMAARYPFYILKDSQDGQIKEAEITGKSPSILPTFGRVKYGFVYERIPHIKLGTIAGNAEIDIIYDEYLKKMEYLRTKLCELTHTQMEEWEIPLIAPEAWGEDARRVHDQWKTEKMTRQSKINISNSRHAALEPIYDKPIEDNKKVRVAGPFTVESTAPHRMLYEDENGDVVDPAEKIIDHRSDAQSFVNMILDNLKVSGVQQAHKDEKIEFTYLAPWPGSHICAEGRYMRGDKTVRVGIYIGPEFGTVQREMLREAAVECGDANFDELISCAFSYDALSTELTHVGKIKILPARMNNELHLSMDLKSTGTGNLFVIFGEPDVKISKDTDGKYIVQVNGVDIYNPSTGAVKSSSPDEIACWFIDTNYNGESFFVRHAYFLGANDPYKALKTSLKAEINKDAWDTLKSSVSRPFEKPETGKIAVKIINHLGDEAMKVYKIDESIVDVVDANEPAPTPRPVVQQTETHHIADTRTNSASSLDGLETFIRPTQDELFDLLHRKYEGNSIESEGKYLLVKGEAPIMLVAHLDTVYDQPVEDIEKSKDGNIWRSPQGIGGDDRCGVYALVQCYERSPIKPWLLFTCDEEPKDKPKGVRTFVEDHKTGVLPPELDELKFLVEIDRRGSKDAVYYDCHNPDFERYIRSKGFEKDYGTYTDIKDIAPALDVAAVNLSSGYYHAHSKEKPDQEEIHISELNAVIESVLEIITDAARPETPRYEYKASQP